MKIDRFCLIAAFSIAGPLWPQTSVIMYHNDPARTGQNLNETQLTLSNVNSTTFGKLFSQTLDGQVYAQVLYVPDLTIGGASHNVVFVCTENDSVYAFDADNDQGTNAQPLWQTSFIDPANGITSVPATELYDCTFQISPIVGITATPAIDLSTGTIYVEAMTKVVTGGDTPVTQYLQQLHALDLVTGAEKMNGPVTIQASVPGTGDGGTAVTFISMNYKDRTGLVLSNGVVYTGYSSHCDAGLYHGWVIGYDVSDLQTQKGVFNVTPNATDGSVWGAGDAMAVDDNGNLFFPTGNGTYDGAVSQDYGDSVVKLTVAGDGQLSVGDWFTPQDQAILDTDDLDMASVGEVLLPDAYGNTTHPHLMMAGDKAGQIFLLDRDNLGGYNGPNGPDNVVEENPPVPNPTPSAVLWGAPAYYNGSVYWNYDNQSLIAYGLISGGASFVTSPSSHTREQYSYPGAVVSVSANGTLNGIVWAIQPGDPAILRAYQASDLGNELYSSQVVPSRDGTGTANVKFTPPTIMNGKVYVPLDGSLAVYGLLPPPTPTPSPTASPTSTPMTTPTPSFGMNFYGNVLRPSQGPLNLVIKTQKPGSVEVSVYDLAGERVLTLFKGDPPPEGLFWNGRNGQGQAVASGLYLFVLQSPDGVEVRKVVVLK